MRTLRGKIGIAIGIILIMTIIIAAPFVLYLKVLPETVSNQKFIDYIQKTVEKELGAEILIKNPILKTELSPILNFQTDEILIKKNNKKIFSAKNVNTSFSLFKISQKKIILKKLGADYIFADVNELMALAKNQKPAPKSDFIIDWITSVLYVKKSEIIYKINDKVTVFLDAKDVEISSKTEPKPVHFMFL